MGVNCIRVKDGGAPLLITLVLLVIGDSYCHACWDTGGAPSITDLLVVHIGKATIAAWFLISIPPTERFLSLIKQRKIEEQTGICKMLVTWIFYLAGTSRYAVCGVSIIVIHHR